MHFGFTLDSSDKDLWNIDLLGTDNSSKHFAWLQVVLQTSSRHVFKKSSRHVFETSSAQQFFVFQDVLKMPCEMSSGRLQDVFMTSLQDVFKTSWKTKNCYAKDVLKTSSRHVLKASSRRLEDQQMFAG